MLKFISIILFFTLFIFKANSEIIKKIEVSGNQRVSSETIKIFSEIKVNDDLNYSDLNDIVKKLYSTNYFKDIKINLENNILKIFIVENPIVQTLSFEGVKNKRILKLLNEQVNIREKNSFIETFNFFKIFFAYKNNRSSNRVFYFFYFLKFNFFIRRY